MNKPAQHIGAPEVTYSNKKIMPTYGDDALVMKLYKTKFWKTIFTNPRDAVVMFVVEFWKLAREMAITPVRSFFRVKPGRHSTGWILYILTMGMLLAYNSQWLVPFLSPLSILLVALVPVVSDEITLRAFLFEDTRSEFMEWFVMAYALRGLIQVIGLTWLGWYKKGHPNKRGDSLIYLVLRRVIRASEGFIQATIEPLMVMGLAWLLYANGTSPIVWGYFAMAGLLFFSQEQLVRIDRRLKKR